MRRCAKTQHHEHRDGETALRSPAWLHCTCDSPPLHFRTPVRLLDAAPRRDSLRAWNLHLQSRPLQRRPPYHTHHTHTLSRTQLLGDLTAGLERCGVVSSHYSCIAALRSRGACIVVSVWACVCVRVCACALRSSTTPSIVPTPAASSCRGDPLPAPTPSALVLLRFAVCARHVPQPRRRLLVCLPSIRCHHCTSSSSRTLQRPRWCAHSELAHRRPHKPLCRCAPSPPSPIVCSPWSSRTSAS